MRSKGIRPYLRTNSSRERREKRYTYNKHICRPRATLDLYFCLALVPENVFSDVVIKMNPTLSVTSVPRKRS